MYRVYYEDFHIDINVTMVKYIDKYLLDINYPTDYVKYEKVSSCEGCRNDYPGQNGQKDIGGCLYSDIDSDIDNYTDTESDTDSYN